MSVETLVNSYRVMYRDETGRKRYQKFPKGQKAAALAFDAKVKERKYAGTLAEALDGRRTLDDFWSKEFADHLVRKAPRTRRSYRLTYEKHIEPRLGETPLNRLRLKRVRRFAADLDREGVKPSAADGAMKVLSAILGLAEADELIGSNPVPRLRRKRPDARLVSILVPEVVEAIRARLKPRDAIIVSMLAYAGLRPHELCGLRWGDIGEQDLFVPTDTKTGSRPVRLLDPLRRDLAEWRMRQGRPGDAEHIVPALRERADGDGRLTPNGFQNWQARVLKPAAAKVGRPDLTAYYLRHSFASLLAHEGRSVVYIAEQLGHGPELSLRTYQRVVKEFEDRPTLKAEDAIREARAGGQVAATG